MDLLNLLEQLTAASGVSGSENSIAAVAQELLTPYCDTVEQRQEMSSAYWANAKAASHMCC